MRLFPLEWLAKAFPPPQLLNPLPPLPLLPPLHSLLTMLLLPTLLVLWTSMLLTGKYLDIRYAMSGGNLTKCLSCRYNEMAVTDYVEDIYSNLRRKEMELAPPANYMTTQEDINDKMRTILVDWLIEV